MSTTQQATVTTSKQYRLNWVDAGKAFIVAIMSPIVPIIMASLDAGSLSFPWKTIGVTAMSAAVAYLVKNFFTPSQTVIK